MSADEAGDALLFAVESLRSALPPELPPSALIAPPSPNDPKFSRERALAALTSLARAAHACSSSTRLHPVQFEVVFRQIAHALGVINGWGPSSTSEEALDATIDSLHGLLSCALLGELRAAELLCAPPMRSTLGHAFSTLLALASPPMRLSGARRATCVRAVRALCERGDMQAGVLAFFLPGVASRLASLASSDEKLPTAVLVELLGASNALLLGCLTDALNESSLATASHLASSPAAWVRSLQEAAAARRRPSAATPSAKSTPTPVGAPPPAAAAPANATSSSSADLCVDRTSTWIEDTATRLHPLLARVCGAAANGSWRARYALIGTVRAWLLQCTLALQPCLPLLLEHVYAATRDTYPQVARVATSTLRAVGRRLPSAEALASLVRDGFESQLRALPATARGVQEGTKARALAVLTAQITLVNAGGGLRRLLSARLGTISAALLATGAMSPHEGAGMIEVRPGFAARLTRSREARQIANGRTGGVAGEAASASTFLRHAKYTPWPFAHLRDTRSVEAADEVCHVLGQLGGLSALSHQLLLAITANATGGEAPPRAEALWILDGALRGAARAQRDRSGGVSAAADAPGSLHSGKGTVRDGTRTPTDGGNEDEDEDDDGVDAASSAYLVGSSDPPSDDDTPSGTPKHGASGAMDLAEVEECVAHLLSELLSPAVWHAPSSKGTHGSLTRQHYTALEHEALLVVAGSAFELLAAAVAAAPPTSSPPRGVVIGGGGIGVGASAAVQVALRRLLFPLLERLGDSTLSLASAAEVTLCRVCVAIADPAVPSVAALLADNADFLLDTLSGRLRHASRFAYTAQVVQAVLEFGGERALPIAADIIADVMRLVDDATPLVSDVAPDERRAQQRATFRSLEGADRDAIGTRTPPPSAPRAILSASDEHLVGWLRTLHALVLVCAASLKDHPGPDLDQPGAKTVGAPSKSALAHGVAADENDTAAVVKDVDGDDDDSDDGDCGGVDAAGGSTVVGLAADETFDVFFSNLAKEFKPPSAPTTDEDDAVVDVSIGPDGLHTPHDVATDAEAAESAAADAEDAFKQAEREAEEKAKPPPAGAMALEALTKVEVLLLSGPPAATHILLDVLAAVIPALSKWPRALLPAAYPLWPPLMQLIHGEDRSIGAHAMRVFALAARATGGEVSTRVVTDAINNLVGAIAKHAVSAGAPQRADIAALASVVAQWSPADLFAGDNMRTDGARRGHAAHESSAQNEADERWESGRGRSQEALLGACDCLCALCNAPRAMRPKLVDVLRACAPLLARHQPTRLQSAALRLCRRLARLEPDAVWVLFVGCLPLAERWAGRPPTGCARPASATLPPPPADIAPAIVRRVMDAVQAADRRLAQRTEGS